MSPTSTRARGRSRAGRRSPRAHVHRRRRIGALAALVAALALALGAYAALEPLGDAVREITLPLKHEDVIRQQARDKRVDPALVAAVIYEESKFRDRTSKAGAKGLMQLLPDTAHFIARRTGGTRFELRDLAEPQVNIAYGTWYLHHLLDRYEGNEELAVAAYNAGAGNVDRWVARAGGQDSFDRSRHVTFPETREYVDGVLEQRRDYREHYATELGL